MDFEKNVPEWKATGTEPPASLKESGFEAGYKPPAAFFNWFWNRVSACLTELRSKLKGHAEDKNNPHGVTKEQIGLDKVSNTPDTEKYVAFASESATARKVDGELTIRLNGGSTANTDMWKYNGEVGRTVNITPGKIGAVDKTGDTMTGNLVIKKSGWQGIVLQDGNGKQIATFAVGTETGELKIQVNATDTDYSEAYWVPVADKGLTGNKNYSFLTNKAPVTVPQGGTGAKTREGALLNLSKGLAGTPQSLALNYGALEATGLVSKACTTADLFNAMPYDTEFTFLQHVGQTIHLTDAPQYGIIKVFKGWTDGHKYALCFSSQDGVKFYSASNNKWVALLDVTSKQAARKNLGFEIQTGVAQNVGTSGTKITFPTAFSGIPTVTANGQAQTNIRITDVTTTGCTLTSGASNNTTMWQAVYISD